MKMVTTSIDKISTTSITVHDIASYLLLHSKKTTASKLQKLIYYSQVWHLVWEEQLLFTDEILAWKNGPVVESLYQETQGKYWISNNDLTQGDPNKLNGNHKETLDIIWESYGPLTNAQLNELIQAELPFQEAQFRLTSQNLSVVSIDLTVAKNYYNSLEDDPNAVTVIEDINFPIWLQ